MAVTLALLEGALTFVAVCWALLWAHAPVTGSLQSTRVTAGVVALCGVAIFYIHNLYDLRSPQSARSTARRLVRTSRVRLQDTRLTRRTRSPALSASARAVSGSIRQNSSPP